MFQKPDDPVALAIDVINTWDELEPEPECLPDMASLRRFLTRRGFAAEAGKVSSRELGEVRALRDQLRAAFEVTDEETAVLFLNRILSECDAVPQLERDGGAWRFRYVGPLVDVLGATTASSLLDAIREDGWARFGRCAGAPCCAVFVDRSRNRSRRYCSSFCADRVASAAYRSRKRAAG